MKKQVMASAVSLILVGAAVYGAYRFGVTRGTPSAQSAPPSGSVGTDSALKAGNTDPKTGKKILYWHDPMVPGQRFDKPGKSPFMDMQLVPVYADGGDESMVAISPRVQQNLGVRTAEVKRGTVQPTVEA